MREGQMIHRLNAASVRFSVGMKERTIRSVRHAGRLLRQREYYRVHGINDWKLDIYHISYHIVHL